MFENQKPQTTEINTLGSASRPDVVKPKIESLKSYVIKSTDGNKYYAVLERHQITRCIPEINKEDPESLTFKMTTFAEITALTSDLCIIMTDITSSIKDDREWGKKKIREFKKNAEDLYQYAQDLIKAEKMKENNPNPWVVVSNAGTDDEDIINDFATFKEARKCAKKFGKGSDIMKRLNDGKLTAEY